MQRISYNEIKKKYPNEWVLISDFDTDKSLEILRGVVVAHSSKRTDIDEVMLKKRGSYAIRYSGKIKGIFALNIR